jgi:hypothetical protein
MSKNKCAISLPSAVKAFAEPPTPAMLIPAPLPPIQAKSSAPSTPSPAPMSAQKKR